MEITTKYNLGDIVYPIWKSEINEKLTCRACAGTGKVILLDNNVYKCPNCNGHVVYNVTGFRWEPRVECIMVDDIFISTSSELDENYIMYQSISSEYYYESECFSDRKSAQLECDKRNKEQNAD